MRRRRREKFFAPESFLRAPQSVERHPHFMASEKTFATVT
jgi:hypothetical protein